MMFLPNIILLLSDHHLFDVYCLVVLFLPNIFSLLFDHYLYNAVQ